MSKENIETRREITQKTKKLMIFILAVNWTIASIKLALGVISGSSAIMADSIESFADGASNIVGYIALGITGKSEDHKHPYGHWKYETYASFLIGIFLLTAGISIFVEATHTISEYLTEGIVPEVDSSWLIVIVLAGTMVINQLLVNFEKRKAKEYQSTILMADCAHTQVDVIITSIVIVSLFISSVFPMFDPLISMVVVIFIIKSAIGIFIEIDRTLGDKVRVDYVEIEKIVMKNPKVKDCNNIRTRGSESAIFLDMIINLDGEMTLNEAHNITDEIERNIKKENEQIIDIVVHVEPAENTSCKL